MLETGEGRANMPVGTIMAMLEEKSVVMSAVHKRLHEAMSQELTMLRELFVECPEALSEVLPAPRRQWAAEEFRDLELVPASDPNVPSQVHRVMLATALATLAGMPQFAPLLDIKDLLQRVLRMVGISDSDKLVHDAAPQQDPAAGAQAAAAQMAQAKTQQTQIATAQKEQDSQRKAAAAVVDAQQKQREQVLDAQNDAANRASEEKIAAIREETARLGLASKEAQANRELAMTHAHHQDDVATTQQATQARQFGGGGF
jgi:hypothetical protein